jgi:hypothetical protein
MSSDNEKKNNINLKIKSEIRKYEILKKSFLKLYEAENKAKDNRNSNFEKLNDLKEYDNPSLKEIYNLFLTEMKTIENRREEHLRKIKELILPVIDYYPQRLKESKKILEDFEQAIKTTEKLEKNKDNNKNGINEKQKINGDISASKNEKNNKGKELEDKICKFESERVEDNKFLFLQFIYSELKYHATALEKMSELFNKINENEPKKNLKDFSKKYSIKVGFNEFGINLDDIENSEIKKKKEEEKNKSEVYGSGNNSYLEEK